MATLTDINRKLPEAIAFDEQVASDIDIPVLAGLQRQGDVFIVPTRSSKEMAKRGRAIPPAGIPVVRGENGGNTHLLVTDSGALWIESRAAGVDLGALIVPKGAVAWLLHPEHGGMGIGPGFFTMRRQREQAEQVRMVAD